MKKIQIYNIVVLVLVIIALALVLAIASMTSKTKRVSNKVSEPCEQTCEEEKSKPLVEDEDQNEDLRQQENDAIFYQDSSDDNSEILERSEPEKLNRTDSNEWIRGTWEYTFRIYTYGGTQQIKSRLVISDNNIMVYTDADLEYNGAYTIEDNALKYDRRGGSCISLRLDYDNERIEAERGGRYYTKVSTSSYSSSSSNTTFESVYDVWNYLGSHVFKGDGLTIRITQQCMTSNGNPLTGAVRITNYRDSQATLTANSPYLGGGAFTLIVDAARGTLRNRDYNEIFYAQ